ncbi:MAG: DNRLRE domain-containing protein, partial [Anaerolineae bacterium]
MPLSRYPELNDRRDAFSRHYDLGNGRVAAVVGLAPLNYQDDNGAWRPIDPGFRAVDGGWAVTENTLQSWIDAGSNAVQLKTPGGRLAWQAVALEAQPLAGQASVLARPKTPAGGAVELTNGDRTLRYLAAWSSPGLVEQFHSQAGVFEQALVLPAPPAASIEAEWLTLRAQLKVPPGTEIFADGRRQTGPFTTSNAVELRNANGDLLLRLAPPLAFEEADRFEAAAGRYEIIPGPEALEVQVQTPWAWWADPIRRYPAVLDPTMQVLRSPAQQAKVEVIQNDPTALVRQDACVGYFNDPHLGYTRGYLKFPLPSLPPNVTVQKALLVAAAEKSFNYGRWDDRITRQFVEIHPAAEDWSHLLSTQQISATALPAYNGQLGTAHLFTKTHPSRLQPGQPKPANVAEVTDIVQSWYGGAANHGFVLKVQDEGFYDFSTQLPNGDYPTFHCFPPVPTWTLDAVAQNPGNPTTSDFGLGLLITYTASQLQANDIVGGTAPTAKPKDPFRKQYHEYDLAPVGQHWRLIAAQQEDSIVAAPLKLVNQDDAKLI